MEETTTPPPEQPAESTGVIAGQPITFGGVAAFALTSWRRLFILQAIVALAGAAAVGVLLFGALLPALDQAVQRLPDNAYILRGELAWPELESSQLVDGHLLAIVVSPTGTHELGRSADIRVELRAKEFRFYSMFGYVAKPYPTNVKIPLSRAEAEPWWGARRPFFIGGVLVGTVIGLWLTWMTLAFIYLFYAKFLAFWGNRVVTWSGAMKLSAAALLTPALVYSLGIASFGIGLLPLEGLLALFILHVVLGWVYVTAAPFRLRPENDAGLIPKVNPFDLPSEERKPEKPSTNPFTGAKE
jgi:hypothetical protein